MSVRSKQEQLDRLRDAVTQPLTIGSAVSGLNLCDMYINLGDRPYDLVLPVSSFPNLHINCKALNTSCVDLFQLRHG